MMLLIRRLFACFLGAVALPLAAQSADPRALVATAVQAELASNRNDHTAFMYRDHDVTPESDTVVFIVETSQGNLKRKLEDHGHPLTPEQSRADLETVRALSTDAGKMQKQRADNSHDDEQAEAMLRLLPKAFLWTVTSEKGELVTLSFKPDPAYEPSDMEARVLSQMAGEIVVSRPQMRIATIRGALQQDVKIGFGILGRLKQGGTFNVERREVAPRHWQVTESHVHIGGHALFFKSIGSNEDESRSDFKPSPAQTLQQAYEVLQQLKP